MSAVRAAGGQTCDESLSASMFVCLLSQRYVPKSDGRESDDALRCSCDGCGTGLGYPLREVAPEDDGQRRRRCVQCGGVWLDESSADEGATPDREFLRGQGLLTNVLVRRSGDCYELSRGASNEALDAVLWFRNEALQKYNLGANDILPFREHGEALARSEHWFGNSRLAQRAGRAGARVP